MLVLFPSAAGIRPVAPWDPWSLLAATAATTVAFVVLLSLLVRMTPRPVAAVAPIVPPEHITFVAAALRVPTPALASPGVAAAASQADARTRSPAVAQDSGTSAGISPRAAMNDIPAASTPGAAAPAAAPSSRLVPSRGSASWTPEVVFDPFRERAAPSPEVRDSLLRDLRADVPVLARTRRPTAAERDAALREVELQRRVSGRPALTTVAGGSIAIPLFEPGPSRAERVRDSISFTENRARLLRLRARADSLRALRP